jgi:hypothetical protein
VEENEDPPAAARRGTIAENLPGLLAGLVDLGYVQSTRSERVFAHPNLDELRIVVGKQVVRFEVPNDSDTGRPWKLDVSYRISTEVDAALGRAAGKLLKPGSPLGVGRVPGGND